MAVGPSGREKGIGASRERYPVIVRPRGAIRQCKMRRRGKGKRRERHGNFGRNVLDRRGGPATMRKLGRTNVVRRARACRPARWLATAGGVVLAEGGGPSV